MKRPALTVGSPILLPRALSLCAAAVLVVSACSSALTPSPPPPSTIASPTIAPATASPSLDRNTIHLLVLGNSIAIPEMGCGGCVGFDQQYASYLEEVTGRAVALDNQTRPEAKIGDLQRVLDTEASLQNAVAGADIVIVSIGYNNTPPWAPELPCHTPAIVKDADLWPALLTMNSECIDATVAIFGAELDAVYGRIEELAAGRAQVRINLGSFDNARDNPGGDGTITDVEPDVLAAALEVFSTAMERWNQADCAAASAHGFVCGDIYHAFNGPDGKRSISGLVNPADFVHPLEAGQALIADLLRRVDLSPLGAL